MAARVAFAMAVRMVSSTILPAILAILVSCAGVGAARGEPPLNGMIYDFEGLPVQGATIEVDGKTTASDVNGRFALAGLPMGQHRLVSKRDGYETIETEIDYSDVTQVVYIKMISADQLLARAEKALDRKDWRDAEEMLRRNEAVRGANPAAGYLRAVFDFRRGDCRAAADRLEGLLAGGSKDPFVQLFLADLYQYRLNESERAAARLAGFLALRYDPDVERRLRSIGEVPSSKP